MVALSPSLASRVPTTAPEWFLDMLADAEALQAAREGAQVDPLVFRPSVRQAMALEHLLRDDVTEVAYGGARYGGKSYLGVWWAFLHARAIIKECGLKPSSNPIPVGFIGRKQYSDLSGSTLDTWREAIPRGTYRIKEQAHEIIIDDTVIIRFGALDSRAAESQETSKFLSAEYVFFFIDQAEESTRDEIKNLRGSLRKQINGKRLPQYFYKGLFTANPRVCWLRDDFVRDPQAGRVFVPAAPTDNPALTPEYLLQLYSAYEHRQTELEAMLLGNWEGFSSVNQVIREEWLIAAAKILRLPGEVVEFLSIDPAREGDDECVINHMANTDIVDQVVLGQSPGDVILRHAAIAARKIGPVGEVPIVIDSTGGLGAIGDILASTGEWVMFIEYGARAADADHYPNIRSEMWDNAAKMLQSGRVSLTWHDQKLISQLCTPEFEYRGNKLVVEPKSNVKKRLGRSPDRADAWIQGLYALEIMRGLVTCPAGVTIRRPVKEDEKLSKYIDLSTFEGRERYRQQEVKAHAW